MKIHDIPAEPGKRQKRKRLGRGHGSGTGTYANYFTNDGNGWGLIAKNETGSSYTLLGSTDEAAYFWGNVYMRPNLTIYTTAAQMPAMPPPATTRS